MTRKNLVCAIHIFVCILINEISSETGTTTTLPQAIVAIIENSYVSHTTILNFYINCEDDVRRIQFFYDLIDFTVRKLDTISVRIGYREELPTDTERHYLVVAVDSFTSMSKLFREIFDMHFNIVGHVLIVLHTFDGHFQSILMEMFDYFWDIGIVDVNVLVEPIPGFPLMFTYFPFTKTSCAVVAPVLCNRFTDSMWENDDLFPLKLVNLHGCSLVCATWEHQPYFSILHNEKDNQVYNGIEGKLLEFIALKMNFSVNFVMLNETQIERTLEETGKVFDELFWDGVDFVIGALHFKPTFYEDYFQATNGYYLSDYNIILSSRRGKISPLAKLLFPFTTTVWVYVLIYFGVGAIVAFGATWLTERIQDFILGSLNRVALYNMFLTALGGGVHRTPKRNLARFLLCTWMILWLVLRSGYQSALFNFIRMDISLAPPENIDDILKENYKIFLTPTVYKALGKLPSIQAASEFLNGTEVENFPLLKEATNKKIAFLTPYEYFGYYKKHHIEDISEFYVVKEHLFTQQLSMYLRRDSFLYLSFNKYILDYYSIGLTLKWEREFIATNKRDEKIKTPPFKVMTLWEVYGAVDIFCCGVSLGMLVFVGEIIVFKLMKKYRKFFKRIKRRFLRKRRL
ncbi:uncharacterized protein LOC129909679 [Episyrphus balteatus]|uniref:uncharacterized protein LOC129909679 n=1 Tax=Episyrphus balteatus TaxID=286459 RepID=UPI002485F48B|nr:uncharacterized protein LOC129909679 [Episyrphus balteatus]